MLAPRAGKRSRPALALARLRFTVGFELCVLAVALWLGLFEGDGGRRWLEREGFGWVSLREGRIAPLFTSALLVEGFSQWLRIAFLLAWALGLHEWRCGWARCALVFVTTHTLSSLGAAGVQALCAGWSWPSPDFSEWRDVGASAGAFGCAGALTAGLSASWRRPAALGMLAYLSLKLLLVPSILSDLTHGFAWSLGILLGLTVPWVARCNEERC